MAASSTAPPPAWLQDNLVTQSRPGKPTTERARPSTEPQVDKELRQLLAENEGRHLEDVAAEVIQNDRTSKAEKSKQLFAMLWLRSVCRTAKTSVPRNHVYSKYAERCDNDPIFVLNSASFGKLVRVIFPGIQTRRLGGRGESKHHYVGLALTNDNNPGDKIQRRSSAGVSGVKAHHTMKRCQPSLNSTSLQVEKSLSAKGRHVQRTTMASANVHSFAHQHHVHRQPLEQMRNQNLSFGQPPVRPMQSTQLPHGSEGIGNTPYSQRTSSRGGLQASSSMSADVANFQHQSLAWSTQDDLHSAWYTTADCLQVLKNFCQSQDMNSLNSWERSRIDTLKTAVESQDWAYTTMHQYYCLRDYNQSSLPMDIAAHPGLDKAVRLMSFALVPNIKLSQAVLCFFARFPYSLDNIRARWAATFIHQKDTFLSFVRSSDDYDEIILKSESRRFPPLAWEQRLQLGIASNTFQRILFVSVLRTLWQRLSFHEPHSRYEARADHLFQHEQTFFNESFAWAGHNPHQLGVEKRTYLEFWGSQLKAVTDQVELEVKLSQVRQPISHLQSNPQNCVNTFEISTRANRPSGQYPLQQIAQPQRQQQSRTYNVLGSHALPSQTAVLQRRKAGPLLPPPGLIQPRQCQPNAARSSLHQAHLRNPLLIERALASPLYQYVQGFVKPPTRLSNVDSGVEKWPFSFDAETMRTLATTFRGRPGNLEQRLVDLDSTTVRLRCIKWPPTLNVPEDHTWTTTSTLWIPYSYFSLNGVSLTQRKELISGKDLPIDITHLVREGENVLEMTVISEDESYLNYLVAIEFLGFTSHEEVKRNCLEQNRIPAHSVLSEVKKKLGASEDEDLATVESNLTINLFDPISASKMCDIPVRSRACLHPDCFDLETFLQTRPHRGGVSMPDMWRCPICNADARPCHLMVDGFLQEVKQRLDGYGRLQTRAIVVRQDGKWKPKADADCAAGSMPAVVIDLSD
ncbi:hypothetical protein HBI23_254020 [Parastagonospora nodorum]|nr:hypothetical protein HBI23_254020 [Parastagonospora nodorum]KAH5622330.1 hypothetical protein HBI51_246900 [Parastagonospora nodorum]KAH5983578.1 hypothetical protein HBI84_245560 [Parastagonospora nodorum]KAH6134171.1 hypothetical protein HBI68_249300 [Parastagonospora nodorum]KAH6380582.1 hypothetical protein HBI08_235120 [Parastagonospora nodorum]